MPPRKAEELSAAAVRHLVKTPGHHAVGNPAGLYLYVSDTGASSWVLRFTVAGQRRHMGLGGFPDVPLKDAREEAREARKLARQGIDPIEQRKADVQALAAARAKRKTFAQAVDDFLPEKIKGFRNPKHAKQWRTSLKTYAYPVIGNLPVNLIETAHIFELLLPIWTTKNETASRVRGRVEKVLQWATVNGYREGPNPATWAGELEHSSLAAPSQLRKKREDPHFAAVPVADVPEVYAAVKQRDGFAARAVEWVMLTGCRSGEARGATWDEIDLARKVWTIPGPRMKVGKPHTVPLTEPLCKLLSSLPRRAGLLFPSPSEKQLSPDSLVRVLRRIGRDETVHGLRSSFKDWCRTMTRFPDEASELQLAHVNSDATRAAYARDQLLPMRTKLMEAWSSYILNPPKPATVTQIGSRA